MQIWSYLKQALENERNSKLIDGNVVIVSDDNYINYGNDTIEKRKIRVLREMLKEYELNNNISKQTIQKLLRLMKEVLPSMIHKEQKILQNIHNKFQEKVKQNKIIKISR